MSIEELLFTFFNSLLESASLEEDADKRRSTYLIFFKLREELEHYQNPPSPNTVRLYLLPPTTLQGDNFLLKKFAERLPSSPATFYCSSRGNYVGEFVGSDKRILTGALLGKDIVLSGGAVHECMVGTVNDLLSMSPSDQQMPSSEKQAPYKILLTASRLYQSNENNLFYEKMYLKVGTKVSERKYKTGWIIYLGRPDHERICKKYLPIVKVS